MHEREPRHPLAFLCPGGRLEVHVAHAAHVAGSAAGGWAFLLQLLGDHGLGGDQDRRHVGRVLESCAHHLIRRLPTLVGDKDCT